MYSPQCHGHGHSLTPTICYTPEINKQLIQFKNETFNKLQPFVGTSHKCTLLLMSNLAQPHWVSVNCNEELLDTIACFTKVSTTKNHPKLDISPKAITCKRSSVLLNGYCYLFESYEKSVNIINMRRFCKDNQKNLFSFQTVPQLDIFLPLFHATSSQEFIIVSADPQKGINTFMYKRTVKEELYTKFENIFLGSGIFVCFSHPSQYIEISEIFFKCKTNSYISSSDICNRKQDCTDENSFNQSSDM